MIASLTGTLTRVEEGQLYLEAGPIVYELLFPAADLAELQASLGETVAFHTIFYLGGDPTRGGLEPTLIGFLRPLDKDFFNLFTTVKGIGPKKALRALAVPVAEIAGAIETKNTRFLIGLPEIGKRTAEQIVAELAGKTQRFVSAIPGGKPTPVRGSHMPVEEDAIVALISLGERRPDAERLLDRAKQSNPDLKTTDALLREMLRLRTA